MHAQNLYEYAVIRVVPKVEREEFLNVGIVLFCKRARFLKAVFMSYDDRLKAFAPSLDADIIEQHFEAFAKIAAGEKKCGPIAEMDTPERFRWLTAVRSSVLQTSRPHPGFCEDPEKKLADLFRELVAVG